MTAKLLAYLAVSCAAILSPPFRSPPSVPSIYSNFSDDGDISDLIGEEMSDESSNECPLNDDRRLSAATVPLLVALSPPAYSTSSGTLPSGASSASTSTSGDPIRMKHNDILQAVKVCPWS